MNRQEAIEILNKRDGFGLPAGTCGGVAEAIDIAIQNMKALDTLIDEYDFRIEDARDGCSPDYQLGLRLGRMLIDKHIRAGLFEEEQSG